METPKSDEQAEQDLGEETAIPQGEAASGDAAEAAQPPQSGQEAVPAEQAATNEASQWEQPDEISPDETGIPFSTRLANSQGHT